jgi:hypothetical protein
MSFLKELRDAAKADHRIEMRLMLRSAADEIGTAIDDLATLQTTEAMQRLNGLWSHAVAVLKAAQTPQPPAPQSSEMDLERKAA